MADYSNCTNGAKGRFGSRFKSWDALTDARADPWSGSDPFTKSEPYREHVCRPVIIGSDGRALPVMLHRPPNRHHNENVTTTEERFHRVQPSSPNTKDYTPGGRKTGFSGGMFQRPRTDYGLSEPALIIEGGWARPSSIGWKVPPEQPLSKVTNDIGAAVGYMRDSARPISSGWWAGSGRTSSPPGVINDVSAAADYERGSVGPTPTAGPGRWGPASLNSEGKKVTSTIDSREAVRRYGGQYI